VTRTIHVTRTEVETIYVERFPWIFISSVTLGVLIMSGLIVMAIIIKREKGG